MKGDGWTDERGWQAVGRFTSDEPSRQAYERFLIDIGCDEAGWEARGLIGLSRGWAIGPTGWRRAMAKAHSHLALAPGLEQPEVRDLRESRWESALSDALAAMKRTPADLATEPMKERWKPTLAARVRRASGAPIVWLAARLQLGAAASLRSYLCRLESRSQQRTTA